MKKLLFVMNPHAGKQKANRLLPEIIDIFNRADYQVQTYMTAGRMDGAHAVERWAKDVDLVVCCGGDGTFNEAVNGIMASGADTPLGYIPAGSTNDFACSLKLPSNILTAARSIVEGTPHRLDIGLFDKRHFTYVASFGAFTKVSYSVSQSVKKALGHTAYLLGGIRELSHIHKSHVRLELDGNTLEDDFIFGAVSNSTSVGGILTLDPMVVDMTDGKFEVMLIRAPKKLSELGKCITALRKHTYNCEMISFCTASDIHITADADMDWTLDGEREPGHEQIHISNLHHAIQIMKKDETQ